MGMGFKYCAGAQSRKCRLQEYSALGLCRDYRESLAHSQAVTAEVQAWASRVLKELGQLQVPMAYQPKHPDLITAAGVVTSL